MIWNAWTLILGLESVFVIQKFNTIRGVPRQKKGEIIVTGTNVRLMSISMGPL